jgi:PTH1 family peptidyl-tRNA hydrolase
MLSAQSAGAEADKDAQTHSAVGLGTLIVGLGNPGERYERTPHNFGFWVVDELAQRHSVHLGRAEGDTLVGTGRFGTRHVLLAKPQTFMNNSGLSVGAVIRYRNLSPENLIVVYDELDLPWSALRIKKNGSAAGHNGVKSVIAALKTDEFTRVRVGIRPDDLKQDAAVYVLAPIRGERKDEVPEIVSYTADAVEAIVAEGVDKAMAKFNRRARGIQTEET